MMTGGRPASDSWGGHCCFGLSSFPERRYREHLVGGFFGGIREVSAG